MNTNTLVIAMFSIPDTIYLFTFLLINELSPENTSYILQNHIDD